MAPSATTRVLSGIKPTGYATLGNFLGALRIWVADQHEHDAFWPVVDLHALTVPHEAASLRRLTLHQARMLVAVGLDPAVSTIFLQSHVPEHTQLAWLMECTARMGELRRMTQFKEKSGAHQESASAGLFTYPALMAADILLYDADRVPVGEDQKQHLELARDLATRFNHHFGETFRIPEPSVPKVGARIMDLQAPTTKMGKSHESPQGIVYVLDDPADIERKFKRAVTDTGTEVRYDPEAKPGVSNLLTILGACTGRPPAEVAAGYDRYGPLKADAAAAVVEALRPVQARYRELEADPGTLEAILADGAERAQAVAAKTLARAYEAIGLLPRR
ncbi:MAG TPA: tryptophan--tRNA ligase [Acidimicrobiales bacterium]|nr:tryptophan--tRNA ligase [Acidimicrobiales bacterium]